jgi:cytochrome b involved in lipid metabolism
VYLIASQFSVLAKSKELIITIIFVSEIKTSTKMAPNVKDPPMTATNEETVQGNNTKEVYYKGYFYDVTEWVRRHPGGKIIEFYTKKGEDATLPIQEFHNRSIKKVTAIMNSLKKRPATLEEREYFTLTLHFRRFKKNP